MEYQSLFSGIEVDRPPRVAQVRGTIEVVVLCDQPVGCWTHFLGRTVACVGSGCEGCLVGDPRFHSYFAVGIAGAGGVVVLPACRTLLEALVAAKGERGWLGCSFELRRGRGRRAPAVRFGSFVPAAVSLGVPQGWLRRAALRLLGVRLTIDEAKSEAWRELAVPLARESLRRALVVWRQRLGGNQEGPLVV